MRKGSYVGVGFMGSEILAFYLKLCGYLEPQTVTRYIRISPRVLNLRFFSILVPPAYPNILTKFKKIRLSAVARKSFHSIRFMFLELFAFE